MNATKKFFIIISLIICGITSSIYILNFKLNNDELNNYKPANQILNAMQQLNIMEQENFSSNEIVSLNSSSVVYNGTAKEILLSDFVNSVNLSINSDNKLQVEGFCIELTDEYVVRRNSQEYVDLNKISHALGYNIEERNDDTIELSRLYSSKRLMVVGEIPKDIKNYNLVRYEDYKFLQFASEKETQEALDKMIDDGITVSLDTVVEIEPVEPTSILLDPLKHIYDSLTTTWGYDYMNFDDYNAYIEDKYDSLDEIVVAVLDSGINSSHVMFKNRIKSGGKNFCSYYSEDNYEDDHGHGSHVAGIITQCTTSNVKILPIKVLDKNGYGSKVFLAYEYVIAMADEMNIKVVNCSFGAKDSAPAKANRNSFNEIIFNKMLQKGITCVVAAGNESMDAKYCTPSNVESAITVGNLTPLSTLCPTSNYGEYIDVVAPGTFIMSATNKFCVGVTLKNGTSMAAPHIAAAVAMLHADKQNKYSAEEVQTVLKHMITDDLGEPGFDTIYGYGKVDMKKAINLNNLFKREVSLNYVYDGDLETQIAPKITLSYSGYKNIKESFNIIADIQGGMEYTLFMSNTTLQISGENNWKYEIAGYRVSIEHNVYDTNNLISNTNQMSIQLKDDRTYIYILIKPAKIKVTVNFLFEDVPQYKDFASYGAQLFVTLIKEDASIETLPKFVSGYRLEQQIFVFEMLSTDTLKLEFVTEGDSVIEYLYDTLFAYRSFNYVDTRYYNYLISFKNNYTDFSQGFNITISILI